jgi:hypothetical protein
VVSFPLAFSPIIEINNNNNNNNKSHKNRETGNKCEES